MNTHSFKAQDELSEVRHKKLIVRRKKYNNSRLQKWRSELAAMRKAGASYHELAFWLRHKKRIKVSHTTILRYFTKLAELQEVPNAKISECQSTS